jgi:hypothetical protein
MPLNIEDHKVYIDSHKTYMVPYTIVISALTEQSIALTSTDEFEKALEKAEKVFNSINSSLPKIEDIDD